LQPDQVTRLQATGAIVARLPEDSALPASVLRARPALAANFGKLWLDRMFPGYEVLIWLDADSWLQDAAAIRLLEGAAQTGALAIVPGGGRGTGPSRYAGCGADFGGWRRFGPSTSRMGRMPGCLCLSCAIWARGRCSMPGCLRCVRMRRTGR
jgi:hypothetical protein